MQEYFKRLPIDIEESLIDEILADHYGAPGSMFRRRRLVGIEGQMKIEIYSNEHPPPHFHVKYSGLNGSFRISDCEPMKGCDDYLKKRIKGIKSWHSKHYESLVKVWNETRPSDCVVGKIK